MLQQSHPRTKASQSRQAKAGDGVLPVEELGEFRSCLRRRFKKSEIDQIVKVAEFAAQAHDGQKRHDGTPYITHPLAVASIVSDWHLDGESVKAALLHDVVEDTDWTVEQIRARFGKTVSLIVDSVSKIEQLEQFEHQAASSEELTAETFRKLLLAVSKDWRVILIKLADRLHNMRTLSHVKSREKRRSKASETLDIYAPIAERLGFQKVRDELQTLAFEYIHPVRSSVLGNALEQSQHRNRKAIPRIRRLMNDALRRSNLKATISIRHKNLYSIYCKMIEKNLSFSEVDDIVGFRLIVPTRLDCYTVLGVMHEKFRPVPEKLKDYIAHPKVNGYQSLHTTVLAPNGVVVELQIRTFAMDQFAEHGVAAHWIYKVDKNDNGKNGYVRRYGKSQSETNRQLNSLYSMSKIGIAPGEYLSNLRMDLFPNDVFVLTPKGKVIQLAKGATVLDMAYAVHTDMGDRAECAYVNGKKVPVSAPLASGDIVKIETSEETKLNPQWLTFVASSKARSHIRNKLKSSWTRELVELGRNLFERSLQRLGSSVETLEGKGLEQYLQHNLSNISKEDLFSRIALDIYQPDVLAKEILGPEARRIEKQSDASISLAGESRAGITRAKCCEPLPPESIVGVMQRNKGLIVHRRSCAQVARLIETDRHISMHWGVGSTEESYRVSLLIECTNRTGLLASVLAEFPAESVNIVSINLDNAVQSNPVATIEIIAEVKDALQIERLIRRVSELSGVTVRRAGTTAAETPEEKPRPAAGSRGRTSAN